MRTSNKILIGAFIATILIITGIHVSLRAKADRGELVILREERPDMKEKVSLGTVKNVLILGMEECTIIQSDTATLEMRKNWQESVRYTISNDTLIIAARMSEADQARGRRIYVPLTIFLPPVESITAVNSGIQLHGAADTAAAASRVVKLGGSHLFLSALTLDDRPAYWDSLHISATHSQINIPPNAVIGDMNASIAESSGILDDGARFGSFSLDMDSTSSVNLRAGSLQKLKLNKP